MIRIGLTPFRGGVTNRLPLCSAHPLRGNSILSIPAYFVNSCRICSYNFAGPPAYQKWCAGGPFLRFQEVNLIKMVYICSPLRGDYGQNIKNAVRYCEIAAGLGVLPLAPHTIFTQYLNDTIPQQRQRGLDLGLALLEKCDELWVMGRKISEGMRGEIVQAQARGMPTYQIEDPLNDQDYPISADGLPLLGLHSCKPGGRPDYLLSGDMVVLRHDYLLPQFRRAINQFGVVDAEMPGGKWNREAQIPLWNIRTNEQAVFDRAAILGIPTAQVAQRAQEQLATLKHAYAGREEDSEDAMEP